MPKPAPAISQFALCAEVALASRGYHRSGTEIRRPSSSVTLSRSPSLLTSATRAWSRSSSTRILRSAEPSASPPAADIHKPPGDRRRRRHRRRDEVGAALEALAALEVAVRGRGAALLRGEAVGVHGEAHRAAGLAPVEARGDEDAVEPLGLGLHLDEARARYDHGADRGRDLPALDDLRDLAQVLDASVGARADEHPVEGDVGDLRPRLQAHVVERPALRVALVLVRDRLRVRHGAG